MIKTATRIRETIEFIEWTGKNLSEIQDFIGNNIRAGSFCIVLQEKTCELLIRVQPPGCMGLALKDFKVSIKDRIIKGVNNEFYSCIPHVFAETYIIEDFKRDQI